MMAAVVLHLRIVEDGLERVDRTRRHLFGDESFEDLLRRVLAELFVEDRAERFGVLRALEEREARVFAELGPAERAEDAVQLRVAGGEVDQVTVRGFGEPVELVERRAGGDVLAEQRVGHHAVGPEERERDVDHRDAHVLAAGAARAREERGGDRLRRGVGSGLVDDDVADQIGDRHIGILLDRDVTGDPLQDRVVDAAVPVGPRLAVAADRDVDRDRGAPRADRDSAMPRRSTAPGRKFCTNTSARSTMRSSTSRPRGCFRSSATERLPRLPFAKKAESPSRRNGAIRNRSPIPGGSTLITSAP